MKDFNYEITLNNTPYYIDLLNELYETLNKKQKILSKIRFKDEINSQLDFQERHLLKHLNLKEEDLLKEILKLKGWKESFQKSFGNCETKNSGDFDEYQNSLF